MQWKDTGGGIDFEPAPAGTHAARCYQIVDLGTHHNEMYDNYRHQVYVGFELPNEPITYKDTDGNEQEGVHVVGKFYTMSLSEKANLRKDLESWRGKAFTEKELEGFDPKVLLGVPAMVSVIHKTKGEKTRANITAISKTMKGMEVPAQVHDGVYFSLDDFSQESFDKVSKGLQNIIRKSEEWAELDNPAGNNGEATSNTPDDDFDDEIPF